MSYLVVILAYLFILFIIGLRLTRRLKSKEDFLVAGRTLTAPVLVGTLLATWIGSGDIFSVSDLSYNHGFSSLIGSSGGWLGIIIVFFIAGRVRTFGQFTVPDILEARYNKWARILDAAYAAYTVYGAGITPALVAVFFWKRATAPAGVFSILGGMTVTVAWEVANKIMGHLPLGIPAVYPAVISSLVLLIGVSLLTPKPPREKWQPFTRHPYKK